MADKALAVKPTLTPEELEAKNAKRELRLKRRELELKTLIADIQFESVRDVRLKKFAGKSDQDLDAEIMAGRMSVEDAWKVKEWRKPKKAIAFALEASNQHVTTMLKREGDKATVKINVENATIQLPEKRDEMAVPVYIDIVASDSK